VAFQFSRNDLREPRSLRIKQYAHGPSPCFAP